MWAQPSSVRSAEEHATREIQLAEQWRIGGTSESEGEFFALIVDLAVGPDHSVFLLDLQLSEVRVFSREGKRDPQEGRALASVIVE